MAISIDAFSTHDQQIWEEELQDFVPDRVFDAHIHMFQPKHLTASTSTSSAWGLADFATLQQWAARLYPGRETHFLVLGTPMLGMDIEAHNRWCIEQVRQDSQSHMNRLVTPTCHVEDIRRDIREQGFIGLKPYRLYSVTGDIAQCRIHEWLSWLVGLVSSGERESSRCNRRTARPFVTWIGTAWRTSRSGRNGISLHLQQTG